VAVDEQHAPAPEAVESLGIDHGAAKGGRQPVDAGLVAPARRRRGRVNVSSEQDSTVVNRGQVDRDWLEAYIRVIVDRAPPLTPAQLKLIRQLLPPLRRRGSDDDAA
jgi:hypothetical protein